jgi:hypothetical protein
MVTEPSVNTSITFTQALEQTEGFARAQLPPDAHERLSAAAAIVRSGGVFQDDAGHWQVHSTSEPGKVWHVNGSCTCPDSVYRGMPCKHRYAVRLAQRTLAMMRTPHEEPPAVETQGEDAPAVDAIPLAVVPVGAAPLTATATLAASLDAWTAQRALITQFIQRHFRDGVDFYSLNIGGRGTKPSLAKAGAEKFLGLFHLHATFRKDDETWEMLGRPVGVLCYRCELHTSSGEVVGEGRGCRDVKKDSGDANKAIKMGQKSSLIDAVLRTGALSEVFTQDVEDMSETADARTQKQAA